MARILVADEDDVVNLKFTGGLGHNVEDLVDLVVAEVALDSLAAMIRFVVSSTSLKRSASSRVSSNWSPSHHLVKRKRRTSSNSQPCPTLPARNAKFGIFGTTPGSPVPDYLHRANTLSELAAKIGVDEIGLLRTVDRFNPEAAQARDPQFQRGDTMFDRYFGAFYPRLGKDSPDARFPATTAKARMSIAAAIGPVVSKLAGRVARKNDPERMRSVVVGPRRRSSAAY